LPYPVTALWKGISHNAARRRVQPRDARQSSRFRWANRRLPAEATAASAMKKTAAGIEFAQKFS
jgi:hypothetical protein